ncbi:hypothetical protein K8R43_02745 [archaeon]|nr:hypothetical protein [archaeon]
MKRFIVLVLVALFVVSITVGFGAGFFYSQEEPIRESVVVMKVPAVKSSGDGMIANLTTLVKPGSGQILVNINDLYSGFETQRSAKIASQVASDLTGRRLDDIDIIYTIEADASSIEGPSAGAALTISTIAALRGMQLNQSVTMTGSIKENGNIGPASGIPAKIRVSEEYGAKLFLLPKGQMVSPDLKKREVCDIIGGVNYCKIDYVENASQFEMSVQEVIDVEDAWRYFI